MLKSIRFVVNLEEGEMSEVYRPIQITGIQTEEGVELKVSALGPFASSRENAEVAVAAWQFHSSGRKDAMALVEPQPAP